MVEFKGHEPEVVKPGERVEFPRDSIPKEEELEDVFGPLEVKNPEPVKKIVIF